MRTTWTRAWLATFVVLVGAAAVARNSHSTLVDVEQEVLDWLLDDADTSLWDRANTLGAPWLAWLGVLVMGLVVAFFDRIAALVFPLTLGFAVVLGLATRALVERPRPDVAEATTHSFPSLTVIHAGMLLGSAVLLLWWFAVPKLIWQIATEIAIVLLIAVAIARIVAGEHWPSDTVGSAIVITLALMTAAIALEARPRPAQLFASNRADELDALPTA